MLGLTLMLGALVVPQAGASKLTIFIFVTSAIIVGGVEFLLRTAKDFVGKNDKPGSE